jgi:hypothetical protein
MTDGTNITIWQMVMTDVNYLSLLFGVQPRDPLVKTVIFDTNSYVHRQPEVSSFSKPLLNFGVKLQVFSEVWET